LASANPVVEAAPPVCPSNARLDECDTAWNAGLACLSNGRDLPVTGSTEQCWSHYCPAGNDHVRPWCRLDSSCPDRWIVWFGFFCHLGLVNIAGLLIYGKGYIPSFKQLAHGDTKKVVVRPPVVAVAQKSQRIKERMRIVAW